MHTNIIDILVNRNRNINLGRTENKFYKHSDNLHFYQMSYLMCQKIQLDLLTVSFFMWIIVGLNKMIHNKAQNVITPFNL